MKRDGRNGFFQTALAIITVGLFLSDGAIFGQRQTTIPSQTYYAGKQFLVQGRFSAAREFYQRELNGATRVGSVRWIDSICYYAMLGESCYALGDYPAALEAFEAAIDLYIENSEWPSRTTYLTQVTSVPAPIVPWGAGNRRSPFAVFPDEGSILVGEAITEERLRQGGMMSNPELRRINPVEIMNCSALALRRRLEILGPLAAFDPRSQRILQCFSTSVVPANHWAVTWLDTLYGMALAGVGKNAEAQNILSRSLLMRGQFDHHLTAPALLTLGALYLEDEKPKEAADCFFEASVSAYYYEDWNEIEESVRKYIETSRAISGQEGGFPYAAAQGLPRQRTSPRLFFLTLSLEFAEDLILKGRLREAADELRRNETLVRGSDLETTHWTDHWNYLQSILLYADGKMEAGDTVFHQLIAGATGRSLRYYQIKTLDRLVRSGDGGLTARAADNLYSRLLRESNPIDWAVSPIDSLVVDVGTGPADYEAWFLVLVDRDRKDEALEVAERSRRRRFYADLNSGGRLFQLRLLLESDEGRLADSQRVLRRTILQEYPVYSELTKKSADLKTKLRSIPATLEKDSPDAANQKQFLEQLLENDAQREALLKRIAMARIAVPAVFPPILTAGDIQSSLPPGYSILSFFEAHGELFGFLLTADILDAWRIGPVSSLEKEIASYLKLIGSGDSNRARTLKELTQDRWQTAGENLLTSLLGDPTSGAPRFAVQFEHLVIVPDSVLWYLPFETLSLPQGDRRIPLLKTPGLTVEYAPAIGSAFSSRRSGEVNLYADTVLVPGVFFGKTAGKIENDGLERLKKAVPKPTVMTAGSLGVPARAAAFRPKTLIDFYEIVGEGNRWTPLATSKSNLDAIGTWEYLPWGAPETIILPGFRSPAESALKNGGNGQEFFVPLLILQARGTQSVLMTRWRTGGRSSFDLVENFLRNRAEKDSASAWKLAVETMTSSPLVLDEEPRFKGVKPDEPPKGDSPFFWGGFLLVNRGIESDLPLVDHLDEQEPSEAPEGEGNEGDAPASDDAVKAKKDANAPIPDDPNGVKEADAAKEAKKDDVQNKDDASVSVEKKENESADSSAPSDQKEKTTAKKESKEPVSPTTDSKPAAKKDDRPKEARPITDEELKKSDEEADDFYSPKN